jgi:hypothetical protein
MSPDNKYDFNVYQPDSINQSVDEISHFYEYKGKYNKIFGKYERTIFGGGRTKRRRTNRSKTHRRRN